ncbi:unnamed protein product [Linum trigynum]|uniref:Uncharacterized protein n=1 Tax=Linum trigynum TaxID=586398 RepID=A0AAV2D335_9ROSI
MNCAEIPASNCDLDSRMDSVAGIPASDCELGEAAGCLGFLVLVHLTQPIWTITAWLRPIESYGDAKLILIEVHGTFEELLIKYQWLPGMSQQAGNLAI